jgi:hypothetical protein
MAAQQLPAVRSGLGHQPQKALSKRQALAVLEEFVGAQAECLEVGLSINPGVEISDCVSDIGFKQIAILRMALIQIKGGDYFHDEFTVLLMTNGAYSSVSASRVTPPLGISVAFELTSILLTVGRQQKSRNSVISRYG